MERLIKFIRHPSFPPALLTSRNPYLDMGEMVFELDVANRPKRFKVGPGLWNDLPYFVDDAYLISTPPTNPLGDATGDLSGLTPRQILEKILHPYVAPVISNVQNNAGSSYGNFRTIEIGISIPGPIQVIYNISNPQNLVGSNPIVVSGGGIFGELFYPNTGSLAVTPTAPLNPSTLTNYVFTLKADHVNGRTPGADTTISFQPRAIWGVSPLTSYSASDINNLSSKQTILLNNYRRNYTFNGQGYCVVAIPVMLNPTNMIFTDVTDPSAPAGFSMEDLGTLTINNGVGTYLYQIFRSTYYITQPTSILKIS